ncbi:MAG: fructofuranosidase/invertase [Flavobacteriaceae bacterium]|nr:fructofuranosidase/invertase [Flavobacteriaceae bacterium]
MVSTTNYIKAKELLLKASTDQGFLASANDIANYKRVWARDGVICGLAALLDGDEALINTFKNTLLTLAKNQHELGNIPSNIFFNKNNTEVSFGGLAGRVDTISWFIIGVCNYTFITKDKSLLTELKPNIEKGLLLLEAWEFNRNDLIYVPRSGNWADEYITEGHILYDQLLRLWALRCFYHFYPSKKISDKINAVTNKINGNYRKSGDNPHPYHPKAYKNLKDFDYWIASINPSGYQTMFDGFANSLALFLEIGDSSFGKRVVNYSEQLRQSLPLKLLPAFWKPIEKDNSDWKLLSNNCKYEFRNYPYEFHNGGTWQIVNAFYGIGVHNTDKTISIEVLEHIKVLNSEENFSFFENFNSKTGIPNGIKFCAWSAAGEILLTQYLEGKKLLN